MRLVAVNGSDSAASKTRALVAAVVEDIIDLSDLSAEGLLGRTRDPAVEDAVARCCDTDILVVATPIYRATYSGALKAFFDRFGPGSLRGTVVVLVATAMIRDHFLALDTSGRALVASLDGWTVPKVVYATHEDFADGAPTEQIVGQLRVAIAEAEQLVT